MADITEQGLRLPKQPLERERDMPMTIAERIATINWERELVVEISFEDQQIKSWKGTARYGISDNTPYVAIGTSAILAMESCNTLRDDFIEKSGKKVVIRTGQADTEGYVEGATTNNNKKIIAQALILIRLARPLP